MRARTDQQRAAVEGRERDVFLRAGAGTGKTTVLVDRFCAAALDPEMGVERILAFTFTERAADQLRRRVREELAGRAAAAEGSEREVLLEAMEASNRAWISTIHGFCRRLLASHPAAAGIDPRFRVVDEPEADRLASRAFDSALEEMVERGGAEALELAALTVLTLLQMTAARMMSSATAARASGGAGADRRRDRRAGRGARATSSARREGAWASPAGRGSGGEASTLADPGSARRCLARDCPRRGVHGDVRAARPR
jgi:ATP-dependent exoDNAse (exonuclease V) beta subunit